MFPPLFLSFLFFHFLEFINRLDLIVTTKTKSNQCTNTFKMICQFFSLSPEASYCTEQKIVQNRTECINEDIGSEFHCHKNYLEN